jgi:hypothetical protein
LRLPSFISLAARARNPSFVRSEIKSLSNSASIAKMVIRTLSGKIFQSKDRETLGKVMVQVHKTVQRWSDFLLFAGALHININQLTEQKSLSLC